MLDITAQKCAGLGNKDHQVLLRNLLWANPECPHKLHRLLNSIYFAVNKKPTAIREYND